ncbi:MAG TPA: LLM class flavin-dependent oxidoreductase [Dehalococcoidia bacterium]|nr:LLM class flavin-dependent oxidoreductase [Dehalococcoidia bacterium]
MADIRLGVHTGQQDIELDELRSLWRKLDESGFDLVTVWDHFYESPPRDGWGVAYESLTLLSAMALETQQCRIGCFVFGMGYRNPAMLAKALTTIDHLSHGRVTVGLGAGWHIPEHMEYGWGLPDVKERLDKLSEGARIMRMMFSQETTTFEGKHYKVTNARNIPQPVNGTIPIVIGGGGEKRTMAIAARRADEWNVGYIPPEVYAHKQQVMNEWCEKFQRDPATIKRSVQLHFYMSSTGQQPGAQRDGALFGEPQQVIDRMGEYVQAGAEGINIVIRPPVDWDALQSYVEDVMPAFRSLA